MIRIELPVLISKLNSQCKIALENAASLCIDNKHSEVSLAHFISAMLENPLSDVRCILDIENISTESVTNAIAKSYPVSADLDTYPPFSPLLVEALQEAWLLSSTELQQNELRSGAILLSTLLRKERYFSFELVSLLDQINTERLRKHFDDILKESSESVSQSEGNGNVSKIEPTQLYLEKYCTNITQQAQDGQLDPVLCRDEELNLIVDILCSRRKNNPIVVGEAGVGKSAVIEGLALRIISGQVPDKLKEVSLCSLDLGLLQAGASVKGEFEKRLKGVIDEVKSSSKQIILFIDEAHTLIGSGNQEGGSDAANLLKPALARGELSTIAATTWKEYKKYFEKDPALTRRFQLVKIEEPSIEQSVDILRGLHQVYEEAHGVFISDCALKAASELSARYLSGRQLPDKAIDVLDTACARLSINRSIPPKKLTVLESQKIARQREIDLLERQTLVGKSIDEEYLALLNEEEKVSEADTTALLTDWQTQKGIVDEIVALRDKALSTTTETSELTKLKEDLTDSYQMFDSIPLDQHLVYPEVNKQQIAEVISDWTGIPISQMNSDELYKITHLPSILGEKIRGQDIAIKSIHRHLLTSRADLRRAGRPKGSFLLVGPSGVGKTETVIKLTEELYGGKQFLTTINMSEYQEKHTVSRLIGSPPGYVGYGEGGILTEAIRKKPYSVVLLDEVEKAHPEVLNLFYQTFDKGELSDGEGRSIDCQNVLFFLTSNLGYQTIVDSHNEPELLKDKLYPELAEYFKPALLARMEVVPYLPLDNSALEEIVKSKISYIKELLTKRYSAEVIIDDTVYSEILKRANRSENGARLLEAIIEGELLPNISLPILSYLAEEKDILSIYMTVTDGDFVGEVR
ncbi:type VI secretion system ATPase TssH [Marinomonas posidonica]|uniref:Type VI secretion ATPase, ClpV1 family n=1 Tax=Marinomonas posidonica (strain CECT 7376 / NCIMB 14433 / IVIA-Po-181) TaxID=491952 RepID=F6CWV5_MARPP|nr:type VI secretion system ATPase TssH [Marinomonas posidonica]AEF55517.1 type VI secretion ATPase, ClpV1 family [Marinomonas posidonica IVIA-Po-181]